MSLKLSQLILAMAANTDIVYADYPSGHQLPAKAHALSIFCAGNCKLNSPKEDKSA